MRDLTTGPITRHLLRSTGFMLVMMVFQTLYFLVDLYWVGRLGTSAVAAVGVAGNLAFIVVALTQMLGVGTTTVISHATGRKDRDDAQRLFHQSQVLAVVTAVAFVAVGLPLRAWYASVMSADAETARFAADYLAWFIPAMALQFPVAAMGAALRGIGLFKPGMIVSTVTVGINMLLAPFLIFGWGTGRPLGVAGAAIASLIAIVIALGWLATYFVGGSAYLTFDATGWRPRFAQWWRMLRIGLPAGFEFVMIGVYVAIVLIVTRPFGASAQAGFGIGMRIIQAGFLFVIALGFSVAPVAGQNFGARLPARVRETFRDAALMAVFSMLAFTILCVWVPGPMVAVFTSDPAVIAVGRDYLRIIALNLVASGLIFVASSMFQGLGNTVPSLVASAVRVLLVAIPVLALSRSPRFDLHWIWLISVAASFVQLALSLYLLRREFAAKLRFDAAPPVAPSAAVATGA